MRANAAARMTEPVTIVHLADDVWTSQTLPQCAWQLRRIRNVGADGMIVEQDALMVQIPEDQGDVAVSQGDWMVRGAFDFVGDAVELAAVIPDDARRVGTIRDLRGGLSGIEGPIERYASVLVLEAL